MIPEAAYAMLACARIGAIHSVVRRVFAGQPCPAHHDCQSRVVIHRRRSLRGGKEGAAKANVDAAIAKSGGVDWWSSSSAPARRST